ncbi:hypothetical protein BC943DRAFT_364237 [Umbelopsis sp. AD052]|nr:hypothetical protein BC943DRAFT_364237 [Umbelopsis sp. AD052]
MKTTWLLLVAVAALQASGQRVTTTTDPAYLTTTTTTPASTTIPTTTPSPSTTTPSPTTPSPTTTVPTTTIPSTTIPSTTIPTTTTPTTTVSTTTSTSSTSTTSSTTTTSPTTTSPTSTSTPPTSASTSPSTSSTSSTAAPTPSLHNNATPSEPLSGGAIAGIVIGSVLGAVAIGSLIFCCVKKRRKHYEDENFVKSTEYDDDAPYGMQEVSDAAPVTAFAATEGGYHHQQNHQYMSNDPYPQHSFSRQRTIRNPASSYGYPQQPDQIHYDNPNVQDSDYMGQSSGKYEDPSSYHNPNSFSGAQPAASAAGMAAVQYERGYQTSQQQRYAPQVQNPDQYDDQDTRDYYETDGHTASANGDMYSDHLHATDHTTSSYAAASPERRTPSPEPPASRTYDLSSQQLPPPHGLDRNWDLYNYASYTPPKKDT